MKTYLLILVSLFCLQVEAQSDLKTDFVRWLIANEALLGQSGSIGVLSDQALWNWNTSIDNREFNEPECRTHLSNDEKMSLAIYSSYAYEIINKALRENNQAKVAELKPLIDEISLALNKLPAKKGVAYRYINLPPEVLNAYSPGAVVHQKQYTSTSVDSKWKERGKLFGTTFFRIKVLKGHDIHCFSAKAYEEEWLLDKNTDLKITAVNTDGDLTIFDAEEVPTE